MAAPKYSQPEIERRWLVSPECLPALAGCAAREIEDRYLDGGRLRLRRMQAADGSAVLKLGKKYGPAADGGELSTSLYLDEAEYRALQALPGSVARKTRYSVAGGALDIYRQPAAGLAVFEIEFADAAAAAAYQPPAFVGAEISGQAQHTGHAVAHAGRAEIGVQYGMDEREQQAQLHQLQQHEDRITELEIKASFSEDLLDHLNQTIVRQQQQIDLLMRELARLKEQGASGDAGSPRTLREELPPHY